MVHRDHLAALARETIEIINRGFYLNGRGERVELREQIERAVTGTVEYAPDAELPNPEPKPGRVHVKVQQMGTFEAGCLIGHHAHPFSHSNQPLVGRQKNRALFHEVAAFLLYSRPRLRAPCFSSLSGSLSDERLFSPWSLRIRGFLFFGGRQLEADHAARVLRSLVRPTLEIGRAHV